jgi:hypothetical protein
MSVSMDHARCSALLGGYAAGALDDTAAAAVRSHLERCRECSAELTAIEAIGVGPDDAMSANERAALRAAVAAATGSTRPTATPQAVPRRERTPKQWRVGLAPALAAAAIVAVVAVGIATFAGMVTGTSGEGGGAVADGGEAATAERARGGADVRSSPQAGRGNAFGERFAVVPELDLDGVVRLWRAEARGSAYDREPEATELLSAQLARLAPDAALRTQVRTCARDVLTRGDGLPPVFGARATVEGRRALVLVFSNGERYEAWAWAHGSCSVPLQRTAGSVAD